MAQTPSSARKHRAILDAAEEKFLSDGYLGTNMDELSIASGVSKQTVYAHFGSKEALFVELIRTMVDVPADRLLDESADPAGASDVAGYLQTYAERQLAEVLTPRLLRLRRLIIGEAGRFPELAEELYRRGPETAVRALTATFTRLIDRGLLEAEDPGVAASQFNWLVLGGPFNEAMLLGDRAIPGPAKRRRHAADAVRVFLAAYATR